VAAEHSQCESSLQKQPRERVASPIVGYLTKGAFVTGIKLDAAWVGGYAKLTADSSDALAEGVQTMATDPLDAESFGELGRALNTAQAYGKASQLLREQLGRAVEALASASEGLANVTAAYQDTDETGRQAMRQELR
jgi:hypothetical protein